MSAETTFQEAPVAKGEEASVLSSILKDPTKLDDAPHLTPEHFHDARLRIMFELIVKTINSGQDLELVSFVRRLDEAGTLDSVGGPAAVTDVYGYAPNHAHFASHCRALTEKLALRRAAAMAWAINEAIAEGKEPDEVADLAATQSTIISDTLAEAKPASDTNALLRAAARSWEAMAKGEVSPMGIETSLVEINQRFCGLKEHRVTVISALPSHGKSLLGGQLFMDAVSQQRPGLFLSWEMTEAELLNRFLAYEARLPVDAVALPAKFAKEVENRDRPTKETTLRVQAAFRALAGYPLSVRAMHGQNISQAIAAIRREHRKRPLGIVVLDFIQRIGPARHLERQPYERQLTDIADRFQNVAQELGFCGIVLSQLNKDGGAKHAEGINESCALHLKIVKTLKLGSDNTPILDQTGRPVVKVQGLAVVKDRFHGQTGELLPIGLNLQTQRFERIHIQP